MSISSFFRPRVTQGFDTYAPSIQIDNMKGVLKLDSGENLWTPSLNLDWDVLSDKIARYPDASSWKLREALAVSLGVDPSWIAIGNGSDELIDLLCRLFLDSEEELVEFAPTFPMYTFFAKMMGATVITSKRRSDFSVHIDDAKQKLKTAKLAFLANPNNPTGTVTPLSDIRRLLEVGRPLVVDEAYIEFGGETALPLLDEFENLIVLRTFSKWAGIAGLRVGFMIARPEVIARILSIKPPYSVNVIAQEIALQIIRRKEEFLQTIEELKTSREWFITAVNEIGLRAVPSQASCVTIVCGDQSAKVIAGKLKDRNVLVKVLPDSLIPNALRVSIAPQRDMRFVVQLLKEIMVGYKKGNV